MNYLPKIEYEHATLGTTTINFTLPPQRDPLNERIRTNGRESRSNIGKDQFQFNYNDTTYAFSFVFLTKDQVDDLRELFLSHASMGKSFKYFPSNDEVEFLTVVLSRKDFRPKRVIKSGSDFIYDLEMSVRVKI